MHLDAKVTAELARLRHDNLFREPVEIQNPQGPVVRVEGRDLVNFSSNDYLGLASHPRLIEAAETALTDWGVGAGASRLVCGTLSVHRELEARVADWKGTPAALAFSTGYMAAIGVVCALLSRKDVILVDKLVHASVVDAARLSGAKLRVFRHNDLDDLERKLVWARSERQQSRCLVVTESVFSMDGDLAPLRNIVELKDRHGAWLMVDEAHASGLYGENRSGLVEEFGLSGRVEIQLVTLGKALGVSGGLVCGSNELVDLLVNRARSFIYSTAPSPVLASAAMAAVELVRGSEGLERKQRLWAMVDHLKTALIETGWSPGIVRSAILPVIVGEASAAMHCANRLRERGFLVPAIRYPTVARSAARLRFTITAAHHLGHVQQLIETLNSIRSPSSDESICPS